MKIGYARVSTLDQNLDLQIDALNEVGCERLYIEKISTREKVRPERDKMLEHIRKDDTIVVWKLDRLARDLKELVELVETFDKAKVSFKSLKEQIDTSTTTGRLVFHIFCALAEFERDIIRERVMAGLESARARGKLGGKPRALSPEQIVQLKKLFKEGEIHVEQLCSMFKISRTTLYKYLRQPEPESRIT